MDGWAAHGDGEVEGTRIGSDDERCFPQQLG
jgi:hypothetical protein